MKYWVQRDLDHNIPSLLKYYFFVITILSNSNDTSTLTISSNATKIRLTLIEGTRVYNPFAHIGHHISLWNDRW